MPSIKGIRSTVLRAKLRDKASQMKTRGTLSAALVAGPKARFWYWIQWGTAGRQDPNAPVPSTHPGTYPIDPVDALVLKWPNAVEGGFVYRMHVDHPGIRPRLFVTKVMKEIRAKARADFFKVHMGTFADMKSALLNETMPFAHERIVASLASEAPGTREDGKLKGKSASEVFAKSVTIENRSSN